MLIKGTTEYQLAGEWANKLQRWASYERKNDNTLFKVYFEPFAEIIAKAMQLGGFAGEVAKTVDKTIDSYGYTIAKLTAKQAWIIASALVEAGELKAEEEQAAPKKEKKEQQPITKREAQEEAATTVATTVEADLQAGDKVAHGKFGEGVVTAITEDKITIDFEDEGEKTLLRKFVKLEKI